MSAGSSGAQVAVPTQLVQYVNDAVDVYYSDGSRLQLSACGSTFRYYHPPQEGHHPLYGQKEIQQLSQFVTSEFREKVREAVDFRNRFATRPFICRDLTPQRSLVSLYADTVEVAWPSSLATADVLEEPDGSLRLASVDEYAVVTLAAHHQYFTSEALCKASQRRQNTSLNCTRRSVVTEAFPSPIGSATTSHNGTQITDESLLHLSQTDQTLNAKHYTSPSCHDVEPSHDPTQSEVSKDQMFSSVRPTEKACGPNLEDDGSQKQWEYVWVSQHHSLVDYPSCWRHAVNILLSYLSERNKDDSKSGSKPISAVKSRTQSATGKISGDGVTGQEGTSTEKKNVDGAHKRGGRTSLHEVRAVSLQRLLKKDFADCVFVHLPKSLPLNCPSLHLHRWKPGVITDDDNERAESAYIYGQVKVICAQGIIYRLVWKRPRAVEIYPGDGSLIRSTGLSAHFFTHYITRGKQVEKRMYSVKTPPPNTPGAPYSVAKLVTRAARFLNHLCEESLQALMVDDPCCWKVDPAQTRPIEPMPTVLLEECTIPDLGHFTAYSNGCLRIEFSDRTCLDMTFDPSSRLLGNHQDEDADMLKRQLQRGGPLNLSAGVCRLLLRSGHYHHVDITKPDGYEQYIKIAEQWAEWVKSTPGERYLFYKDTIYDPDKQWSVDSELKKIQCFNYIVENSSKPGKKLDKLQRSDAPTETKAEVIPPAEPSLQDLGYYIRKTPAATLANQSARDTGAFNMTSIEDVLQKTSRAVADLDRFMKVNTHCKD